MNHWLELLADLKRRNPHEYLTPTQRAVHDDLCNRLRFPQWINLYGGSGTGKTFVAWAVARAIGGQHVPTISALETVAPGNDILLVDNAPYRQSQVRQVLARCDLLEAKSVVLITHHPVDLPMQRVELSALTEDEIALVVHSIERLGYYRQNSLPTHPNLWDILQACI